MTKRPSIQTNEGPPDKRVTIEVTVVPNPDSTLPITITPYKLDLTQFSEKVRDRMTFRLSNKSGEALVPELIFSPEQYFDVTLPKSIPPGESVEGEIVLSKTGVEQAFEKSFTIELNDVAKTRYTIPVKRTLRVSTQAGTATTGGDGH